VRSRLVGPRQQAHWIDRHPQRYVFRQRPIQGGLAEDLIRNRPALSRWHPDYADEFAEFLTLEAPFRR